MVMVNTVVDQIGRMDKAEINQAIAAIKLRQTYLARQASRSFMIGDAVQFTGRGNRTVVGTVIKVNPKTILVDSPSQGRWKVTASMLTSLEA